MNKSQNVGRGTRTLKTLVRVFFAHIKANLWCLTHFGDCVMTHKTKAAGCLPETTRIEVGRGSIKDKTWKGRKTFYPNAELSCGKPNEGE